MRCMFVHQQSDAKLKFRKSGNRIGANVLMCEVKKVRKQTFGHERPEKIQISMRIHEIGSEYSLGAF